MKDIDWGLAAHQAAEAHLSHLNDIAEEEYAVHGEEFENDPVVMSPLTGAPFDGCLTCFVRETLAAAWPVLDQMADDRVSQAAMPDPHQIFGDTTTTADRASFQHGPSDEDIAGPLFSPLDPLDGETSN